MTKPNVILVLTDNQMAKTLGCYGNDDARTPHIDQLAENGVRFDNAYCPNTFCSPARASLLTGKMPSQHGVHSWIDDRRRQDWPQGWHALKDHATLPEILRSSGYKTGLFGKYHLGDPSTKALGWDAWVTMADGHVRSFYDNRIYDAWEFYDQPGHAVDFFTSKAVTWIGEQTEPYFAYIPFPAPYGHWPATNDGRRNRHANVFDDDPMNSVPRSVISREAVAHFERVNANSGSGLDFSMLMRAPNHVPTLRNYFSQISMIDDAVGRLREADPNALIIFTADHGLSLGHHGFWGHGAATYPSNMHHAAHSIPLIMSHPGHLPSGRIEERYVTNMDLFSTVIDHVGGNPDRSLPSRSLAPLLAGRSDGQWEDNAVFAEQEETRVIRTPDWLYFRRCQADGVPKLPDALYDLKEDPGETTNVAGDPAYGKIVSNLVGRIDAYFERYSCPAADLWQGGKPIQNSMMTDFWRQAWGEKWSPVYCY